MYTTNRQQGFIALISSIIIASLLIGLALSVGRAGITARVDVLQSEYKRISLGLAESCVNVALLRLGQNYTYAPVLGGDVIAVGQDAQSRVEECTIESISFPRGSAGTLNTVAITTSAYYPARSGAYARVSIVATIQNPAYASALSTAVHILSWQEIP